MDLAERWAPIKGYEGAYEVSSLGQIRSLPGHYRHAKILKPGTIGKGYQGVSLCLDGKVKGFYVHHLVAAAFIGPRPEGLDVCHNNGDQTDNRIENLRYDTVNGNMRDSIAHGTHRSVGRTHCIHGHEMTEENTYRETRMSSDGYVKHRRRCRICLHVSKNRRYRIQKVA